jgi:hypothetical protein
VQTALKAVLPDCQASSSLFRQILQSTTSTESQAVPAQQFQEACQTCSKVRDPHYYCKCYATSNNCNHFDFRCLLLLRMLDRRQIRKYITANRPYRWGTSQEGVLQIFLRLVRLSSNMIMNIILNFSMKLINSCGCTGWSSICTRADAAAADQLCFPGHGCSNHAAIHHQRHSCIP